MPSDTKTRSTSLLRGAMDIHLHTAPDIYPRSVTVLEAANEAKAAGMGALLVKSHCTDTSDRAEIVRRLTGFPVYGGITLNYSVGGLNIHAVREAIRQGTREVWMPSTSARCYLRHAGTIPFLTGTLPVGAEGITILQENGQLVPEVHPILELIAEYDIALGTSHVSPLEALALVKVARSAGIQRIAVTHPNAEFLGYTLKEMSELAQMGSLLEFHYAFTTAVAQKPHSVADVAKMIRAIGPAHCILATDGGQSINPPPHEMLRRFIAGMLEAGFSDDEIRTMAVRNPGWILGLG
ncbi:MAG: DUF6282 family protein [Planctomycetaceae bacterium]